MRASERWREGRRSREQDINRVRERKRERELGNKRYTKPTNL